jgi:GLPGLI family protein
MSIRAIYKKSLTGYELKETKKFNIDSKKANTVLKKYYSQADETVKKLDFEFLTNQKSSTFKVSKPGLLEEEKGYKLALSRGINTKGIFYSNALNKISIHQKSVVNQNFLVKKTFLKTDWKLENETKQIGKFNCLKATSILIETNSKGISKTYSIVCWYTNEIPTNLGPAGFNGLPGLIVRLQKENTLLTLQSVILKKEKINIEKPTEGIEVENEKEFEKKGRELYYKYISKRRKRN